MLFCVHTGAPHSCIGDKALERIVCHSRHRYIPIIDSKCNFKSGDTLIRSRGMPEHMLSTLGSAFDIPVILHVLDVEIPELLGLDVLDGNNLLVDNVTNNLWNRTTTNKDLLRSEDIWDIKLRRKLDHLYVPLSTPIKLFYTMAQL